MLCRATFYIENEIGTVILLRLEEPDHVSGRKARMILWVNVTI